jgi:hypothetical protein
MTSARKLQGILADLKSLTPKPEPPSTPLYCCQNTNFGAYLITANLLRYEGAQLASNGRDVELRFYDPDARGPDLLRRYNAGAAELVNARALYEVRGYLISEVKRLQAGVGHDAL